MFRGDLTSYMELNKRFYDACVEVLGDFGYFDGIKRKSNELALKLIPIAKEYVSLGTSINDRLRRAVKVSLVGNALDFGTGVYKISLEHFRQEFCNMLNAEIVLDESEELLGSLHNAKEILYVLDNAGEIVFDRLFIEEIKNLGKGVVAAVRGSKVQNDVTLTDASDVRLWEVAEVITTGCGVAGILLKSCSKEFLEYIKRADLVILKGQGNYQSVDEVLKLRNKGLAFLLRVKCNPVAKDLGVDVGDFVVKVY